MKAKATYLIRKGDEIEHGREAWITREPEGLAIGTIYDTEKDAADLDDSDMEYLEKREKESCAFFISKVVEN